jgi:hypothetical protein
VQPAPTDPIVVTTALQLSAEVDKDVGGGTTVHLPFVVREGSAAAPTITVASALPARQGITPTQIAELIGISIDGQVPSSFPALDDIQLEEVTLTLVPSASQPLTSISATIGWVEPTPYPVFGDLITFNGMAVTFTYLPGGYGRPDGSLSHLMTDVVAKAGLAGGTLDAQLDLPDLTFSCELEAGTTIDIAEMVRDAVGSSITMPAVTCTELAVFGDITDGEYRFQATVTDDWTFDIGKTPLALTEISMDIAKSPSGFDGQIACQFEIAQTQLFGRAGYDSTTQGWSFQLGTVGEANVNLTDLAAEILALLGITLPNTAPALLLDALNFSFDTATHAFDFQCQTSLTIAGKKVVTGLEISNDLFRGLLWVGESFFEIDFQTGDQRETLTATWQATDEQGYLEFGDIAEALGLPPPDLPEGLDLRLASATLSYDFSGGLLKVEADSKTYGKAIFLSTAEGGTTEWFAGLAVDAEPIELSNLPLLDEVLSSSERCEIADLRVILSSANISADTAKALNQQIDPGYPTLPPTGTASVVGFGATINFAGTTIPISLGMGDVSQGGGQSNAQNTVVGPQQGGGGAVTTTSPAASDGTAWFNVQKSFGPLTLDKVGVRYSGGVLWFSLNASMTVGGLSLTLLGASIGSPITSFQPQFDLQGLGLDYANPPLQIGGGFAKVPPTGGASFEYDGAVVVKMPEWGLTAFGSYAEVDHQPSLFVFVQVQGTFGGPPPFFVTGVVGGFGYNSSLRIPGQTEVISCPLVAGLTNPSVVGGPNATPMQALEALTSGPNAWVTHSLGETWIAVGLDFTTYELLQSTALLVVEFGNDLTIALLGISTARFPPEQAEPAYAQVQLQLEALLEPNQGFFGISANLTRNSFLLDPACVLTGGFAFDVWFAPSDHAGDFVVVLGGYNPNFDPPQWYPTEPRLGFSWSLDSAVSVSGTAYFALTPSAAMAGGGLAITFHDGNLKAWFTAWADLIVWWRPFHFQVGIGVSIGASYKLDLLFTTTTLTVELGADLTLWGPPTGGVAHVHWYVISFTVRFGSDQSSVPGPIKEWSDFAPLLPSGADVVKMTPVSGLTASPTAIQPAQAKGLAAAASGPDSWLVRSDGFSFTTRSAIPTTNLFVGSKSTQPYQTGDTVDIRPMQLQGLTSSQRLSVTLDGTEFDPVAAGWTVDTPTASVPKALWGSGDGSRLDPGDEQLVTDQYLGFSLQAPPPSLGWSGGPIDVAANLEYDPLTPSGVIPVVSGLSPSGDVPVAGRNTILTIANEIATSGKTSRDALYAALVGLGVEPGANGPLDGFAAQAGTLFTDEPLLVPTPSAA